MNLIILLSCITLFLGAKAGIDEDWEEYKSIYKKQYRSPNAESFRKSLFEKELKYIENHNEKFRKGLVTYEMSLNEFSIYTQEELKPLTGGPEITNILSGQNITEEVAQSRFFLTPSAVDWRKKGKINAVKNQRQCGSCWIFATISSLEAAYAIHKRKNVSLSEQQIVDCLKGCQGGWMGNALDYIAKNGGINYDSDYPYTAKEEACRYNNKKPHVTAKGYVRLPSGSEFSLKRAVAWNGPIIVIIQVEADFHRYGSGVYYSKTCINIPYSHYANHAVTVVGYGRENGQDFWLVRNSWGSQWGDKGYIKMARNKGNNCAIASWAMYPKI